ncbi:hypothetical protein ACFLZ8_01895 [Planctomycetota bacterium]
MKIDINYLIKEKTELFSFALLGISILLAIFILLKITDFFTVSSWAKDLAKTAIEQNNAPTPDTQQYLSKDREIASTLSEENLFVPQRSPENPVSEVRGIWIDSVLINDHWYQVDDVIDGARIVSIGTTQVEIEWEGRVYAFSPLEASIPEPQQGDRATTRGGRRPLPVAANLIEASRNIGATASSAGGGARIDTATSGRTARWGMQEGDIVISINGNRVSGGDSLTEVMNSISTGSAIEAQIMRNGVPMTVGRDAISVGGGGRTGGGRGGGN